MINIERGMRIPENAVAGLRSDLRSLVRRLRASEDYYMADELADYEEILGEAAIPFPKGVEIYRGRVLLTADNGTTIVASRTPDGEFWWTTVYSNPDVALDAIDDEEADSNER